MKIGLIVAIEMDSIFAYYKTWEELPCPAGFHLYRVEAGSRELFILQTGMGEIAAASGTQYLITRFGVELIVNFGVVGGLTEAMTVRRICVIDRVVHYKYDVSALLGIPVGQLPGHESPSLYLDRALVQKALSACPDLQTATCLSGDKFVDTAEEKRAISEAFSGDVCDMESAGIFLTCEANKIPCLLMKAVSDGLAGGANEFNRELEAAAFECLAAADRIMETL